MGLVPARGLVFEWPPPMSDGKKNNVESAEEAPGSNPRAGKLKAVFNALGPFLILAFVLCLFRGIMSEDVREGFFSVYNFKLVLSQTVIIALGSLGMTMIIVSGGIDLSVGSIIALTSVFSATLINKGVGVPAAMTLGVLAGGVMGLVNGSIISGLRMMPFIVTLGMLGIARGLAKGLADNQTVNLSDQGVASVRFLMADPMQENPESWFVAPGIALTICLAVVMWLVMRQTVFGRHVFAIGSNEATARLCGIRVRLMKLYIYGFAGLFFGLAGMMVFSRLRQGDPSTSIGIELDMIAAVVIGGASLSGGAGSILGSMIGALTIAILRSGSIQIGWENHVQEIIIGVVIILAVGLDKWRQSRSKNQ